MYSIGPEEIVGPTRVMLEVEVGLDCVVDETVGNPSTSERTKELRQDIARTRCTVSQDLCEKC